jgi:3-oxoacyl-[acyl-carrier-protein] synthase II
LNQPRTSAPTDEVVVTGVSVLTPLGDDVAALAEALREGRDAIVPGSEPGGAGEARLRDFDAGRYASVRGMRVYHRTTQLGICAAKLALDDAGLKTDQLTPERFGLVAASTYVHLDTLLAYYEGLVSIGVQRTNPTLMPLGLPSAPGAAVALAFGAKAFSITISDGGASSLAAMGLAARLLADDRADLCVVVAAAGSCRELIASAQDAGMTATAESFRVLDERSCGIVFGEASAALVLERAQCARERGAEPKAFVRGYASTFAPEPARLDHALERACIAALRSADIGPAQLALVSTGANGLPEHDRAEARALLAVLGSAAARPPILAVKANLGETLDAAGLLQSIVALSSLRSGSAPAIARLGRPSVPGLRYPTETTELGVGHALVTAVSFTGSCSALVIGQPHER